MDEFCLQEIHMDFVDAYKMCKGLIIWLTYCYPFIIKITYIKKAENTT